MKNNILKISTLLFSLLGLIILSSTPAFASDDNIDYTLELKLGSANDYTPARYRQTDRTANKWKVNFATTDNINVKYANFWLAKDSDRSVVSNIYQFMYKSGDHYCKAHSAANQTYVRLGAENANYTLSESATIKGFWDEETW